MTKNNSLKPHTSAETAKLKRHGPLQLIFIAVGSACLFIFSLPLVLNGILNIGNATGMAVGLGLLIYGIFKRRIDAAVEALPGRSPIRILLKAFVLLFAACVLLAAVISGLMLNAAMTRPQPDAAAIVLGCQVRGSVPSLSLEDRLEAAEEYLTDNPEAVCILSGGQGPDEDMSEALAMYNYLTANGIDPGRLYIEDASRSTDENLRFSYEIMKENGLGDSIAIVTSSYHEYRAMMHAGRLGLEAGAVPAGSPWWLFPCYVVREWYGVLYEWFGLGGR